MVKKNVKMLISVGMFIFFMHIVIQFPLYYGQIYDKVRLFFFVAHNILAIIVYILIFLVRKQKGVVLYNQKMSEYLRKYPSRYCEVCDNFKPERSHHCSKCKRCIRKMDHHCRWLAVCINNDNIGHFIRLLFFSVLDLSLVSIFCVYSIFTMNHHNISIWTCRIFVLIIIFIFTISTFFFVAIFLFFTERFSFVLKNLTFLENCALEDFSANRGLTPEDSPYNLGWKKNLRVQMGYPFLFYMYGENGDGIFFEKRFDCDHWPPYQKKTRNISRISWL